MTDERPVGQRFSSTYLLQPDLLSDSVRMRRRMGALIYKEYGSVVQHMNDELGTSLPMRASATSEYWPPAMSQIELRDVLDAVTLLYKKNPRQGFLAEVRRIFSEEQVSYSVDPHGGVHFAVDAEFANSRAAGIHALSRDRYSGVRQQFKAAYGALDKIPADGKLAIRSIFHANEGLFRLMFPDAHQLNSTEVNKYLKPVLDRKYATEAQPAGRVAHKQVAQYQNWIDAAHFYRHEPGTEDAAQPPQEIAIQTVSSGASWIRWLITFDISS